MEIEETKIHLIFLEDAILLSRKKYISWRQIQDEFEKYKASLGPYSIEELKNYFIDDYGKDDKKWPFSVSEINNFVKSEKVELYPKKKINCAQPCAAADLSFGS